MIKIEKLTEDDIALLKKHFLENRLIRLKDILQPIEEYFWKFDFNAESKAYELFLGIPKEWLHDMSMVGYKIELVNENDDGKVVKIITTSEDGVGDLDDMIYFAIDMIERNNAILATIKEKELQLKEMKEKMIEVQIEMNKEIERIKTIRSSVTVTVPEPVNEVAPPVGETPDVITPPIPIEQSTKESGETVAISQEEKDKFIELITNNGRK